MNPEEKWIGVKLRDQANYGARARAVMEWRPIRHYRTPQFEVVTLIRSVEMIFRTIRFLLFPFADKASTLEEEWL